MYTSIGYGVNKCKRNHCLFDVSRRVKKEGQERYIEMRRPRSGKKNKTDSDETNPEASLVERCAQPKEESLAIKAAIKAAVDDGVPKMPFPPTSSSVQDAMLSSIQSRLFSGLCNLSLRWLQMKLLMKEMKDLLARNNDPEDATYDRPRETIPASKPAAPQVAAL